MFYRSIEKGKKILVCSFLSIKWIVFGMKFSKPASVCSNDPARALRPAASGTGRYSVVSEQGDVPARLGIVYQSREMFLRV